jgi:hypothetical protein
MKSMKNKPLAPPKRTFAFEAPLSMAEEICAIAQKESRKPAAMIRVLIAEALDARAGLKGGK